MSDEKKGYTVREGVGLRVRPTESTLESPDYNHWRDDPHLAEEVVDNITSPDNYAHNTHGPTAEERDREEREELNFMTALGAGINEQLKGAGLRVYNINRLRGSAADGGDSGYVIQATDDQRRRYEATLTFDESIKIGLDRGETMGRGCVEHVCRKLMAARTLYFARMQ